MTVFEITTVTSEPSLVHNDKNYNNDDNVSGSNTGNNNDDENSKTYEDQDDHLKLLYDDDIVIERAKGFLLSQKRRSDRFDDVESCNGSVTSRSISNRSISSRSISSHSGKRNHVFMDLASMRNEPKDTSYVIWCKEKVITNKKNDLSRKQRFCCYSIFSLSSIIVFAILIPLWSFLPSRSNTTTGGTTDNNLNNPVFGNITSSTTDKTTTTTLNSESMNDTIILPDNNNNTPLNSATLDKKNDTAIVLHNIVLSFPPDDISKACNSIDEGANSTACQRICKAWNCCNFPSNLKALSCLDDINNQRICMMYHPYCNANNNNKDDMAIISSEDKEEDLEGTTLTNSSTTPSLSYNNSTAEAATEVTWDSIPSPPSNLNETCSVDNIKTKNGLAECSRECKTEAASCCLGFKNSNDVSSVACPNNGSNPTPPVCLSYAPCLTLSASHHIDEDITTRMEEIECSDFSTVDGRERCRTACSHVLPCCFGINEDIDSSEEKACTAQDHCFQYQICNSLLEIYFSSAATLQTQEISDICHNESSLLCKAICNDAECCFNTVVQNENSDNATIYYNDEQQQCDVDCNHEKYKPCSVFYEMETNYYDIQQEENNNGNTTTNTTHVV